MISLKNRPIGVFDSGIGGLTVLREIIKLLPREDTIYLGDTARLPYGNKSTETVCRYSLEMTDYLVGKGIKLLVVACNTASAVSLPSLQARYPFPILGVIDPGARRAAEVTKTGRVGVIGTERTIKSQAYLKAIKAIDPRIKVFAQACPLFVPLVEEGWSGNDIALMTARRYLKGLKEKRIDVLVLGCTHYPLLKRMIRQAIGSDITLVDSAKETARDVLAIMREKGLGKERPTPGEHQFCITDYPERFQSVGERFLGKKLAKVVRLKK